MTLSPGTRLAFSHAGLGQVGEALALMNRSHDEHDNWLVFSLAHLPVFDDLRPETVSAA